MMNQFTQRSQRVLQNAMNVAKKLNSAAVGTEHLLAGIILEEQGVGAKVISALGFDVRGFLTQLEQEASAMSGVYAQSIDYSPKSKHVLALAKEVAAESQVNYIATEHILIGILREGEGAGAEILKASGITEERVMALLTGDDPRSTGGGETYSAASTPKAKSNTPELDKSGRDLTAMAKSGELDPVIGREKEIERVVQILSRRTKNNPVLIGEPGVGKTAIAEGLAQRIIEGSVPQTIVDKRVVSLDLSTLVAGTKYRGEFEERLQKVLNEIREAKDVIVFIDELHTLIGAGATEGSMDAANILKPALSRGELQCVGATTLDEYRKHIEKDAALERRFQPVVVDEPSAEDTIAILKGLKDGYEAHHKVTITDDAIEAAVKLSVRYITDRFLPDKAIDLIDEASSKVRIKSFTAPPDLKDLEAELEELKKDKEDAVNHQEYESAAKLRDQYSEMKKALEDKKNNWQKEQSNEALMVTKDDIADVVSIWTKIPVSRLQTEEKERLLHLEDALHERLIGQSEAVTAVSNAIRRAGAGLKSPKRPIGSFIFLGPTGVGKTELAKALAEAVFGNEEAMIRIDMSEYMERHTVSRLVGAPPGYVGYDEGGQLTEAVRRNPYCVVLLDEVEKAHPEVFNILLQVLDDGRLTDSLGRTVDFRNTIIIMTSNVGAENVYRTGKSMGFLSEDENADDSYEAIKERYMADLKGTFRPEFINRVDEIIVFHGLVQEDIVAIADLMIKELNSRLAEQKISLDVTEEAKKYLAEKGFDKIYGARPLRRTILTDVEDPLADEILKGTFGEGDRIKADLGDAEIVFAKE
jgi:ATP-dependent Clp protease ATP-binding subunit ClpC